MITRLSKLLLAMRLHGKKILGNRLAALSGAGFEAVGMADNIQSDVFQMKMAAFGPPATVESVRLFLPGPLALW